MSARTPDRPGRFNSFLAELDSAVRGKPDTGKTVAAVGALLSNLIESEDWLPQAYRIVPEKKSYAQYLLFRAPDSRYSVLAVVWPPGSLTPVHDHLIWGVSGLLLGSAIETRFQARADSRDGARVRLNKQDRITLGRGSISCVIPPDDIHQVINDTEATSIAIQVYGGDLAGVTRHGFDIETGEVFSIQTTYDNPREAFTKL